jgi:hypothetical protein
MSRRYRDCAVGLFAALSGLLVFPGPVLCQTTAPTKPPAAPAKPAAAPTKSAAAPTKQADQETKEQKLAKEQKLTEGLAGLAKLFGEGTAPDKSLETQLGELVAATRGTPWAPYFERLQGCAPHWNALATAGREGRAGDIVGPALKGHLLVDAIFMDSKPKNEETYKALRKALIDGATANLGELQRQVRIGTSMISYLRVQFDNFDLAMELAVSYAAPEVRKAAFEAIAAGLADVKETRPRLEGLLRSTYEAETNAKEKRAIADRMAALTVPLTLPTPTPTP